MKLWRKLMQLLGPRETSVPPGSRRAEAGPFVVARVVDEGRAIDAAQRRSARAAAVRGKEIETRLVALSVLVDAETERARGDNAGGVSREELLDEDTRKAVRRLRAEAAVIRRGG
jgi:hypothetical protein